MPPYPHPLSFSLCLFSSNILSFLSHFKSAMADPCCWRPLCLHTPEEQTQRVPKPQGVSGWPPKSSLSTSPIVCGAVGMHGFHLYFMWRLAISPCVNDAVVLPRLWWARPVVGPWWITGKMVDRRHLESATIFYHFSSVWCHLKARWVPCDSILHDLQLNI